MIIQIDNLEKDLSVTLMDDVAFTSKYGEWSAEDIYHQMEIAEQDNTYLLYSQSGYAKQPNITDIRNNVINKAGSQRVSGISGDLELSVTINTFLFCNVDNSGNNIYDKLIATLKSQFSDLKISFYVGCRITYQYYSLQEQDDALGTFTFKGSRGNDFYYLFDKEVTSLEMSSQPMFMTPSKIDGIPTLDNDHADNTVNIPTFNYEFNHLSLIETPLEITITPYADIYPYAFIQNMEFILNGSKITILGEFTTMTINSLGECTTDNPDAIITGTTGNMFVGDNKIKINCEMQRGKYLCKLDLENQVTYS